MAKSCGVVVLIAVLMVMAMVVQRGEVAAAAALPPATQAAQRCQALKQRLALCTGYLLSKASNAVPGAACCTQVRSLKSESTTSLELRSDCTCLKNLAIQLKSLLNQDHATRLPGLCGVSLPLPVSPSANCNKL